MLNEYAQASGLMVTEGGIKQAGDGTWEAGLLLESCGEGTLLNASGRALNKKAALHAAAFSILNQLM